MHENPRPRMYCRRTGRPTAFASTAASIAASSVGNGNTTGTAISGCGICDAKAATAIQYKTTNYTSVGVTAMQYKLYVTLEAM